MSEPQKVALILGAASPLGAALACAIEAGEYDRIILADSSGKRSILSSLSAHLQLPRDTFRIEEMDATQPLAGLPEALLVSLRDATVDIFHLTHRRDRTLAAADIHPHNTLALERVFALAYAAPKVGAVCVVTDVGLAGDFPGVFSEAWTDVGQTPFDDVDKSSLQIERSCIDEARLPIIRFRCGLTLLPQNLSPLFRYWRAPSEVLLTSVRWLAKLPRLISVPAAVADGSLAPLTPADWAADVILHFAREKKGLQCAHHLVVDPKPAIETVLNAATDIQGGARIKGGLPVNLIAALGRVPGFRETARRNADQVAAWWTPHRYCLSKNDLDTAHLRGLLPTSLSIPTWNDIKGQLT